MQRQRKEELASKSACELGLIMVRKELPSQPFCIYGDIASMQLALNEVQDWARQFVCAGGRLIVLTDAHSQTVEVTKTDLLLLLSAVSEARSQDIHEALAIATSGDVLLLISTRESSRQPKISDYAELQRALNGVDLPGEYLEHFDA